MGITSLCIVWAPMDTSEMRACPDSLSTEGYKRIFFYHMRMSWVVIIVLVAKDTGAVSTITYTFFDLVAVLKLYLSIRQCVPKLA